MKIKFYILSSLFLLAITLFFFQKGSIIQNSSKDSSRKQADSLSVYYQENIRKLDTITGSIGIVDDFIETTILLNIDTLKYKAYNIKIKLLEKYRKYNEAKKVAEKLLEIAKDENAKKYIAKSSYKLGKLYKKDKNLVATFSYFNESFKASRDLKDTVLARRRLLSMANIQKELGGYHVSNIIATDGLKNFDSPKDLKTKLGLLHSISTSLRELTNYKEALNWNAKALNFAKKNSEIYSEVFKTKITKANINADIKEFDASILIYEELLQDSIATKNILEYARLLSNLGFVKWKRGDNIHEIQKLLLKALDIRITEEDLSGLVASHTHLSKFYAKSNPEKALYHAEEAYTNAKKIFNKVETLNALDLITALDTTALDKLLEYKVISQQLEEARKEIRQIYAPTRFQNEKLATEAAEKELKIKEQKKKTFWIIIMALIVLFGAIAFFTQRSKTIKERTKKEKIQAVYEVENKISKKVHDHIANDIHLIKMLITNNEDEAKILDKLNIIYNSARDISRDNSHIDFKHYTEHLQDRIRNYITNDVKVFDRGIETIPWEKVSTIKKIVVYKVVKELMVNMQKHSCAKLVSLIFSYDAPKISITYTDDGVGFLKKTNKNKKNGLMIMENLIKSINGTITFELDREKGIKVIIKIPSTD
ncbi:tetratricopeptide repeat-containing sensor histidine kinase [uncultured Kordia sp.]|uniref:ATP-binding protein n=1 Tax=uncultured Kordia sp. TaxID=507699 RepID=UPI002636134F|nr:tetratricopeptide repeat-containing sensor histidine kinase [uncultured Kordia sp.]